MKQQRITEEAEQKRLASEYTKREEQRIRREIEEKELEEAQAFLQDVERRRGKQGKNKLLKGYGLLTYMSNLLLFYSRSCKF